MSTQPTPAPAPVPELHPDDLANLPEFEKPIAAQTPVVPGNLTDSIAHTQSNDPNLYVDDPARFTAPIAAHELMHRIQNQAGNAQSTNDAAGAAAYDYGGIAGLQSHPSISSFNSEQQANIPQDYMTQMNAWRKKAQAGTLTQQDLSNADTMNAAFGRSLRQEAEMARPGNTIDTTPAAPGPPPAALTGALKPLPEIGGRTIELHPDDIANHPRPQPKKKAGAK